jgi:hypothetical protein
LRLAKTDAIEWRNNANSGNLLLAINGSDQLTFNGSTITTGLNSLANGAIWIGSASNLPVANILTGDVTVTNTGVTSISSNVITNSQIAPAAGITYSKLTLTGSILNSDINATAAIAYSKLNLTGSVNLGSDVTSVLPVANGGTGDASLTAYAVLTGGVTSTSPVQSVASVGTAGQVLTSNGAGTLPTFQAATSTGTVNAGTQFQMGYYATSSSAISGSPFLSTTADGSLSSISSLDNTLIFELANTSNTSNAVSLMQAQVAGESASDAYYLANLTGGPYWAWGLDNSDSNAWTLSRAASLGTDNAIRVDSNSGAVDIRGSNTNDSAAAGFVGQYIASVATTTSLPTSGNFGDLTSISLTAGDWDVTAFARFIRNGSTPTAYIIGISTESGNSFTTEAEGDNAASFDGTTALLTITDFTTCVPAYRVSLSATTTIYFKYYSTYTVATPTAAGRLSARRVR